MSKVVVDYKATLSTENTDTNILNKNDQLVKDVDSTLTHPCIYINKEKGSKHDTEKTTFTFFSYAELSKKVQLFSLRQPHLFLCLYISLSRLAAVI